MDKLGKAFKEFYKLGKSGFWCCIELDFDHNYTAYIIMIPSSFSRGYFNPNQPHEPTISIQTDKVDTKGMISFLKKAVKEAKKYEKKVKSSVK